jgi:hypothetical protein
MVTSILSPTRAHDRTWSSVTASVLGMMVAILVSLAGCGSSEAETRPLGCEKCDPHATCNTNRSPPQCTCMFGYSGDGARCVQLDSGTATDSSVGTADADASNDTSVGIDSGGGTEDGGGDGDSGTYTCSCPMGWSGNRCEISGGCGTTNPCQRGTCTPGDAGGFICTCDPGWTGMTCNMPVDCGPPPAVTNAASPVISGGAGGGATTTFGATAAYTCSAGHTKAGNDASCQASGTWSAAPTCTAIMCAPLSPPANGTISGTTTVTYTCNPGFILNGNATRACQIDGSWTGSDPTCVDDPCIPDPCSGHGTCQPGSGTCSCNAGWSGPNCQTPVNSCTSNPCVHGTCTNSDGGGYTCDCAGTGYTGANCDVPVNCGTPPAVGNAGAPTVSGGAGGGTTTTYGATAAYTCTVGYAKGGADATCQASGMWSAPPTCSVISCGAPPAVANAGAPVVSGGLGGGSTTTYGATAVYTCNATYTKSGSDATCQLNGTWSAGPTCHAAARYCDVLYRFYNGTAGDARLHTVITSGVAVGNTVEVIGTNATATGGLPSPSPFTPAAWPGGYVRLRFNADNAGTAPVAGPVQIVEYYVPIEFTVTRADLVTVTTDLDASAGLLSYTTVGCPSMVTGCLSSPVVLNRRCTAVASGILSGTTLSFAGSCNVPNYPGPFTSSSNLPPPSAAQLEWTEPLSQVDTAANTSCLANMSTYGNVTCTGFCNFVPAGVIGVQSMTWDQMLGDFTFSTTSYATATVTIPEFIVPDNVSDLYSGHAIPISQPGSHIECGTLAELTCDEN